MTDAEKKRLLATLSRLYGDWRRSKFAARKAPALTTAELLKLVGLAATRRNEIDAARTIRANDDRWNKSAFRLGGESPVSFWHPKNLTRRVFHEVKWVVLDANGEVSRAYDGDPVGWQIQKQPPRR